MSLIKVLNSKQSKILQIAEIKINKLKNQHRNTKKRFKIMMDPA